MTSAALRIFDRCIKGSPDQEDLGVRHATSTEISIRPAVLMHKGNPLLGVAIEVSDHLALSTSGLSGTRRGRVSDDSNFNVKFSVPSALPVLPVIKEAPQLFGLNERYRR